MEIIIAVVGITITGLAYVFWLFISDKKAMTETVQKISPEEIANDVNLQISDTITKSPEIKKSPNEEINYFDQFELENKKTQKKPKGGSLLGKLGFFKKFSKKKSVNELLKNTPDKPVKINDPFSEMIGKKKDTTTGTASIKVESKAAEGNTQTPFSKTPAAPLSKEAEKNIEEEVEQATKLSELKERYVQLERIFKEKSDAYEKIASELESEKKNRKDFNKVKDILEKEIREIKDRSKETQSELAAVKSETSQYKEKITQLENKATKLEKELLDKEDELELHKKKLATAEAQTQDAANQKKSESAKTKMETAAASPNVTEFPSDPAVGQQAKNEAEESDDFKPGEITSVPDEQPSPDAEDSLPEIKPEPFTEPKPQHPKDSVDLDLTYVKKGKSTADEIESVLNDLQKSDFQIDHLNTPAHQVDETAATDTESLIEKSTDQSDEETGFIKLKPDVVFEPVEPQDNNKSNENNNTI